MQDRLDNLAEIFKKYSRKIEITVQEIEINNYNGLDDLTIAQISDLHINQWNIELIEHMVEILNKINPDIVTMTGDAICNGKKFIPNLTAIFKDINSKYGKFACLGNHDHSDGDDGKRIEQAYKKSDFQILVNESAPVNINGEKIYLAGADDLQLGNQNIYKMVKDIPKEAASIFLTHNPYNFHQFVKYNPDLVLAGHTHGGQLYLSFLNFMYKYVLGSNYISGLYAQNNSKLYVNRGIGTALVSPVIFNKKLLINTPRINSKPEITLFKVISGIKDNFKNDSAISEDNYRNTPLPNPAV